MPLQTINIRKTTKMAKPLIYTKLDYNQHKIERTPLLRTLAKNLLSCIEDFNRHVYNLFSYYPTRTGLEDSQPPSCPPGMPWLEHRQKSLDQIRTLHLQ